MKCILLAAAALLAPVVSFADVGIGGSIREDEATLYVPISAGDSLRIEPYFSWYDQDDEGPGATDYESVLAGVGVFGLAAVVKDIRLLGGARLAYSRTEVNSVCCSGDLDGYRFEPTVGAEYLITEKLSVALEEYLYYSKLEGQSTGAFVSGPEETETKGTGNRLIVRFMF